MTKTPLNNIPPEQILPLHKITDSVKTVLNDKLSRLESLEEKIEKLNYNIENVDSPFKEARDLKEKVEGLEYNNAYLRKQLEELELINANLNLNQISGNEELNKVKEAYKSLLVFTFTNINPITDFDPAHAKHYWENLIK